MLILISTSDSGTTWTDRTTGTAATDKNWASVVSSSDGINLVAVVNGEDIWTSTGRFIQTFYRSILLVKILHWRRSYMLTSSDNTHSISVFLSSSDSGLTWIDQTIGTAIAYKKWISIASSSDGVKLVAVASSPSGKGNIWTSTGTVSQRSKPHLCRSNSLVKGRCWYQIEMF